MRFVLWLIGWWLLTGWVYAGEVPPPYRILTYDEDYRYLRNPGRAQDLWDKLKYIPLDESGKNYLSLGAELRERYENLGNPVFDLRRISHDDYLLQRLLLNADLHLGAGFRAFIQFNSSLIWGKQDKITPIDQNPIDIAQGFVDFNINFTPQAVFTLRAGRQEILLGSGRLVTIRNGANNRLAFDGIRGIFNLEEVRLDAFFARPVFLGAYAFDDRSNNNEALWGVYSVFPIHFLPDGHGDFYYLGFERVNAVFTAGVGLEDRHSVGLRLWGKPQPFDYDFEFVGQFGRFNQKNIEAWTVATSVGYTFQDVPLQPRLGLKFDIASGDKNPSGNTLQTFNALYPSAFYFTEAALNGPSNFIDLHPALQLQLAENVAFSMEYDWLWRESVRDGIYAPSGQLLLANIASSDARVGTQWQAKVDWQLDQHTSVSVSFTEFQVSDALRSAGAKNVEFALASIAYRF